MIELALFHQEGPFEPRACVIIVISMNFAVIGLNSSRFGARETEGGMAPSSEEKIMALYAIYVVHYPRVANKTLNTAAYADCSLSTLRDHVYDRIARYPGGRWTILGQEI